jgi:hypothetical protein
MRKKNKEKESHDIGNNLFASEYNLLTHLQLENVESLLRASGKFTIHK